LDPRGSAPASQAAGQGHVRTKSRPSTRGSGMRHSHPSPAPDVGFFPSNLDIPDMEAVTVL
jgi:hypothetical protein